MLKHEELTTAQRLVMALASPRPHVDDPSTAERREKRLLDKERARVKRLQATRVTSPLRQNPDWTPGSPAPQYLADNRAARRARKVAYRRILIADAKRKRPETEAGAALRNARIAARRDAAAQIYRGRIEKADAAIEQWQRGKRRWHMAVDCHIASADRNTALLAALGVPA
jgi:hypothetical protein